MRSKPVSPFANAWGEVHFGPSSIDIGLLYSRLADLQHDFTALQSFRESRQYRSGYQMRIERAKRGRGWLELSCWSRDPVADRLPPAISVRLAKYASNRQAIVEHLQQCDHIAISFVSLEGEEDIDKAIRRIRSGVIAFDRGTNPIILRQMRILGRLCRASLS